MSIPDIFIKNVAIKIDDRYMLSNEPLDWTDDKQDDKPFVGREKQKAKMLEFLEHGGKGVFLVTGYRGMGKTSFVHKVLHQYSQKIRACSEKIKSTKKKDKLTPTLEVIDIALAQNNLTEGLILRTIVNKLFSLAQKGKKEKEEMHARYKRQVLRLMIVLGFVLVLSILTLLKLDKIAMYTNGQLLEYKNALFCTCLVLFTYQVFLASLLLRNIWTRKKMLPKNFESIETLYKRCYSSVSSQSQTYADYSFDILGNKITTRPTDSHSYNYPVATIKEIEYGLEEYLELQAQYQQFIFIFDELDKIEPPAVATTYQEDLESVEFNQEDNNYLEQLRQRKQTIINVIAGLKNFLTTTNAKFFFIAGREMFDASLADIADRESPISSIFNYVFYVESLLKETGVYDNNASLSHAIEKYLGIVMFGEDTPHFFKLLNERLDEMRLLQGEKNKINVMIQSFVIYLTYRSNGSPKKLIRTIHEFIRSDISYDLIKDHTVFYDECGTRSVVSKYLYFNLKDQYRIGFINYLYRPFLIKYGKNFLHYSDNIVSSTPYLFDHLIKFHAFAFSLKNLEQIPEMLSDRKTQSLREHIRKIINYLYNNHIRETEIGLFDYKFYSRILHEITYISKTFEDESAAFNFTLDESYLVKLHIRSKLKKLRGIYAKFGSQGQGKQIFSIFYLNTILGDLHFFDQEYDDAIVAYSDAIHPFHNKFSDDLNFLDFISVINCKLKLGLTFEKIKFYEKALAYYTDAADCAKRYILDRLARGISPGDYNSHSKIFGAEMSDSIFHTSSFSELLQIINQSFLAKTAIQEKLGIGGTTGRKFMTATSSFLFLTNRINERVDIEKNHLVIANYFLVSGNLLYFKNDNTELELISRTENSQYPELNNMIRYVEHLDIAPRQKVRRPVVPLAMYITGLREILKIKPGSITFKDIKFENSSLAIAILRSANYPDAVEGYRYAKSHYRYIAIFLSNIGNSFLAMCSKDSVSIADIFNYKQYKRERDETSSLADLRWRFFKCINDNEFEIKKLKARLALLEKKIAEVLEFRKDYPVYYTYLTKTELKVRAQLAEASIGEILHCFYLSAVYFLRAGRSTTACYQLKKILYVLRLVLDEGKYQENATEFIDFLEKFIMIPIDHINSKISEFSDSHMYGKLEKSLNDQQREIDTVEEKNNKEYIKNNLSNHSETREASMLFHYIRLKVMDLPPFPEYLVSPYNSISSQFTRLLEFDFYQKKSFQAMCDFERELCENKTFRIKRKYIREAVNYLYSLLSIINILTVYEDSYTISFNYFGYIHLQIAEMIESLKKMEDKRLLKAESIFNRVQSIPGIKVSYVLSNTRLYYQVAKSYFEKAIQLHTCGEEYKRALEKIVYLEDDLNDNAFHFGAAMERHLFTNGALHRAIKKCELGMSR